MAVSIRTNNKPRDLLCFADLSEKARKEFDYVDEEEHYSPRFVKYKGTTYDVNDTTTASRMPEPLNSWDSYISDSFFSGVVFRFPCENGRTDYERIVVGTYAC